MNKQSANRLADFLHRPISGSITKSNHWQYFSKQSVVEVSRSSGRVSFRAGAGFDDDYELNFRAPELIRILKAALKRLFGRDDAHNFRRAFYATTPTQAPAVAPIETISALPGPITAHKYLAHYYLNNLLPHASQLRNARYLEIGPGTGYLAALFRLARGGTCTIIDLPEMIPFSFLFLTKVFPDADFLLPNEITAAALKENHPQLVFLTPDSLHLVPDYSADTIVNTASFGEMLPQQIKTYFEFMRRVIAPEGLFFTANRVEKWMNQTHVALDDNVPEKGIAVRFEDYPWSAGDRDVFYHLSEFHNIVQPQNPILMRLVRLARN